MTQPGRAPRGAGGARSAGHAGGRRSLRPTAMAFLATFALVLAAACGAPPGGPGPAPTPDENGRPIVITSPRDGGRVSGAVFFAAQPLEPVPLADVALFVGGERVHPTFPGESPLRVYLIPRDHPEGPLQLRARVRVGGATFEDTITVQVVHEPPSTATVGAGGALLGDREANGAVSTVAIPPGVAGGATMSFAAFSQEEVKAETGVDYDALGVTFLGAQRIDGSAPTGDRVLMTSGGFGPMVQPGQTVVSYRITGDLGRGTGELMVINGASVAPNGDVVSNPAARPQAGATVASSVLGVTASATPFLLEGLPPGPPGTRLAFTVTGINHLATHGYAVRFRRAGGVVGEVPALVGLGGDGRQYLLGHVPSMAAGDVNVELVALAGDEVFARYTMRVTAAPPVPADPKGLVDLALAEILDLADALDDAYLAQGIELDLDPLRAFTQTARAGWAARPASDPELQAVARLLAGGGQVGSLAGAREVPSVTPSSGALCLLLGFKYVFDRDFHARAFQDGDLYSVGFRAISSSLTFDHWDKMADRLEDTPFDCDPIAKELCEAGIGPGCAGPGHGGGAARLAGQADLRQGAGGLQHRQVGPADLGHLGGHGRQAHGGPGQRRRHPGGQAMHSRHGGRGMHGPGNRLGEPHPVQVGQRADLGGRMGQVVAHGLDGFARGLDRLRRPGADTFGQGAHESDAMRAKGDPSQQGRHRLYCGRDGGLHCGQLGTDSRPCLRRRRIDLRQGFSQARGGNLGLGQCLGVHDLGGRGLSRHGLELGRGFDDVLQPLRDGPG